MKLIPSFLASMRPKSSLSSPSSSLYPPPQSIKARKGNAKEEAQVDIPMFPPPHHLPLWSSLVLETELEHVFRKFDANGDGGISPSEVKALLQCLGDEVSEEEATHMVKEADKNKDGFLDLHEFIDIMTTSPCPPHNDGHARAAEEEEEELQCAFQLFDKDKNGLISAEELHEMLRNLGERESSLQDCHRMIRGVDHNKDGVVDYQEFKAMMIVATST